MQSAKLVILLATATLFALEMLADGLRAKRPLRPRLAEDLSFIALNFYVARPLWAAAFGFLILKLPNLGMLGGQPLAFRITVAFLGMELCQYWTHRALHYRVLWPFHAIHHQPAHVDCVTSFRLHPLNFLVIQVRHLVLLLIALPPEAVSLLLIAPTLYAILTHSKLRWHLGPLETVFVSPASHLWHHSSAPDVPGNFGTVLNLWDVLFKTYRPSRGTFPASFGAKDFEANSFSRQLWKPFQLCWKCLSHESLNTEQIR